MSKTCSPGSFPEGKVGDSGRFPGRRILNIMFSVPEVVPNRDKDRQRERFREEEKKRVR